MSKDSNKKRQRQKSRVWTRQEEEKIARYLVDQQYLGKDQAKETLLQYEKRMLSELEFTDCGISQLHNKCFAMKKKYEETRKWINSTGQGVLEDSPESFKDVVEKRCHYDYILDEVLSGSQAVNPSYQRVNGIVTIPPEEAITPEMGNITQDNTSLLCETAMHDRSSEFDTSINEDLQLEDLITDDNLADTSNLDSAQEDVEIGPPTKRSQLASCISKSIKNLPKPADNRVSSIQRFTAIYASRNATKATLEEKKLQWEEKKFNLFAAAEKKKRDDDRELEKEKLELERKKLKLEFFKLKVEHPELNISDEDYN